MIFTPAKPRYHFFKIMTGSDLSRRRLPVMVMDSGKPGSVIWLTACCHGDEVGGIVTIQDLFKSFKKNPLLHGAVYAFPLMNPIGFETISRKIPFSQEDLNRLFPGDPKGSLGERIADIIFSTLVKTHPTLVLDLHNDWIRSIPYVVLDALTQNLDPKAYEAAFNYANQLGFIIIKEESEITGTLSSSLLKRGIPALTVELGESYVVNERNISFGVRSIQNILMSFSMIDSSADRFAYALPAPILSRNLCYSDKPLSSTSGIIRFRAKPGVFMYQGQAFAKIYNAFGRLQETLKTATDGLVLGHSDSSVAFPGMPVMAFGLEPSAETPPGRGPNF